MDITRRGLLGASAAAGAGLLLPFRIATAASAAIPLGVTPFTEQLPTLAQMGVIDATKGGTAKIRMVNATHSFHKTMAATPTFAYRSDGGVQDYLGPVIVAKRNVPFNLTVVNELGAHPLADAIDTGIMGATELDKTAPRACVHLHGGNTDPASDGDPLDFYGHGKSKTYHYGNTQEAAGLWYHDHTLGITRLNVFAGLAGGYLVRDANDTGDGCLLPAPPYEVPLVLQDRTFTEKDTFDYPVSPWVPEFFGDVATVNGKIMPNLDVDRGKYRFRVYNGSNARFYNFGFRAGASALTFFQIGTDGGLLNRPVRLTTLLLSPGERADLVVDFAELAKGAKVILTNDAAEPYPNGDPCCVPQIMQFTGTGAGGWTRPLTMLTDLRRKTDRITRLALRRVDTTRSMTMVEVHDALTGEPTMVLMNNRNFMPMDGMKMEGMSPVKSNTLEEWELINTTVDAHPMHLHFAQFQVINRQAIDRDRYYAAAGYDDAVAGSGIFPPPAVGPYLTKGSTPRLPAANERGWKDTIVCLPGEVTRIRIPFGPKAVPNPFARGRYLPMAIGAAHTGDYVSHCHILEHEENDMMMRFTIVK
jgi:FtsP/CotA-like multicopper oxidase with cupredoxin domain